MDQLKNRNSCGALLLAAFFVLAGCLLAACSSEDNWEESLAAAAPQKPADRAQERGPLEEELETPNVPTVGQQEGREQNQEAAEQTEITTGVLVVSVNGLSSCRFGAVRCYLDRRYQGALDEQGSLRLEVEPGVYEGELVDSEGQWFFVAEIKAGQTSRVTLNCSGKVMFGDDEGRADDPEA